VFSHFGAGSAISPFIFFDFSFPHELAPTNAVAFVADDCPLITNMASFEEVIPRESNSHRDHAQSETWHGAGF
jgi:hypothetical protein